MIPKYRVVEGPMTGDLTGAEIIAIEQAERYGTDLVVLENGRVAYLSPQEVRESLGYPAKGRPASLR